MKILNFLLPIAFIAVLVTGLVLHFKTEDREISEMENRTLQQGDFEPTFKNVVSGEYVKKVESYITDQFPYRDDWMKSFVKSQIALGESFIKNRYYVDAATGWIVAKPFPVIEDKTIELFANEFAEIQQGLAKNDIPMAFFTFPAKATYVLEPSPDFMPVDGGIESNNRLHVVLTEKGIDNAKIMDSIPEGVDVHDMYFKTDHHWKMYGAYQGYLALMENINERIGENIEPIPYDETNNVCLPNAFSGSWNKVLYMTVQSDDQVCYNYPESFEKQFQVYKGDVIAGKEPLSFSDIYGQAKNADDEELVSYASGYSADYAVLNILNKDYDSDKHIVVVKDSYFNAIQFHVASHFKQLTVLDLRYLKGNATDIIAELNPDYVFFAYNDRNFDVVKKY
ncbi:DHHW family protein [Ureibacillus composti]|nr:DHHW family protein [Ureibacillus composti]